MNRIKTSMMTFPSKKVFQYLGILIKIRNVGFQKIMGPYYGLYRPDFFQKNIEKKAIVPIQTIWQI